jgi:tRNA pseudouridine32 synthase/23S rRNA pseudouridine746 synthase
MTKPACFTLFSANVNDIPLPEKFTFPFYYQPHPIAIAAAEQLQLQLATQSSLFAEHAGKMFGVLVVQNSQYELGFLAAYSGQFSPENTAIAFVEPVSTMQIDDDVFLAENRIINTINAQLTLLENSQQLTAVNAALNESNIEFEQQLLTQHSVMQANRQQRKLKRHQGEQQLTESECELLLKELASQSIQDKKHLQAIKTHWQGKLRVLNQTLEQINSQLAKLKKRRKTMSKNLQKRLFSQYNFLNGYGEEKDLNAIFSQLPEQTIPSGAGDCAAPKLLQYAFKHNLKPVAMAEFWWGSALKSAIRQHKNYYPACYSKCQPILGYMLEGLQVEDNPLLENPADGKSLPIIYQDDDMLVVNKPAEFLSVPGVNIEDSVYTRIKNQFPHAAGPLIVHRLDMSTSGLLMVALNKRSHKALQKQFIERSVEKRYVALVQGNVLAESGTVELPLRLDFDDKPRQLVCYEHGKKALTTWQVIERNNGTTRLHLYPKTGRTHQLRVHCAHHLGLNMPILGDTHYGKKAERLHLHAEYLALNHPITRKRLTFEVAADF